MQTTSSKYPLPIFSSAVKKIGVALPNLGTNQEAFFAIATANNLLTKSNNYDVVFFYENATAPIIKPLCATMNLHEVWSFDGHLITTTLDLTNTSINIPVPAKRIFYVTDLEWLRGKKDFVKNIEIMRNPLVKLITKSEDYKKAIENYCNRKVEKVVENFDLEELISVY